ncbi:MAG: hypothetical protein MUP98_11715, partial [Candidatus Aminicenantes bacterium]|nr:hypothetical protein [Candidatus Aminicenantes bacterium]
GHSSDCVSCHLSTFQNTTDPDHELLSFPTDCETCHSTSAETWEGAEIVHDTFVLTGQHLLADCIDCHADGIYAGHSSDCVSCHLSTFQNTTDPDHELLSFPTDCETCHSTSAETWENAFFDHNVVWLLQGAHTTLDCSQCHTSGSEPPRECYGCHAEDYDETSDPDHEAVSFPTVCEFCHYPTHITWTQAQFEHDFPIDSGNHSILGCTDCHLTANYLDFSCIHCHSHNSSKTNNRHKGIVGYSYSSQACYACHLDGE